MLLAKALCEQILAAFAATGDKFGLSLSDLILAPVLVAFVLWMVGIGLFGWANGDPRPASQYRSMVSRDLHCVAMPGCHLPFSDSSEIALHIKS
jgi:hypothetical protein